MKLFFNVRNAQKGKLKIEACWGLKWCPQRVTLGKDNNVFREIEKREKEEREFSEYTVSQLR